VITYLKAQATAIIGSIIDFLITIFLVEAFSATYVPANLAGNICGAVTQFFLARTWAFNAENGKISSQIFRYIISWVGFLLLSAGGVYSLTHFVQLNYIVAKTITSVFLGLTYNYVMQKKFVFAKQKTTI
jgi:putative flippase GtrA